MNTIKIQQFLWSSLFLLVIVFQFTLCSNKEENIVTEFEVQFELPSLIDITQGGEYTFRVKDGKSPSSSDIFIVESSAGISLVCPIIQTSSESFTIRFSNECQSGSYKVFIKRGDRKKLFGSIHINLVEEIGFEPDKATTIYGVVSTNDGGVLKNVVVSDGEEVTVTNEAGIYQLKSAKKQGYLFISIPSGYEVSSNGVLPQFFYKLKATPDVVERVDFKLTKVNNQDSYKLFMLGDMHLANRTSDAKQFKEFTTDLTNYMDQQIGRASCRERV